MHSYIVLVSPSYGGAEKRFFDIFTSMFRSGLDVTLVAPLSLSERLQADHPERADVFGAMLSLALPAWSRGGFIKAWRARLAALPRGGHYHYPLNCLWPLHLGRGDRVSMSMVDCAAVCSPFGGTVASVWGWVSARMVDRVDVLSPAIFRVLQQRAGARKTSLTPGGTYLVPAPAAQVDKQPLIVFMSRLVPLKGVLDWLDVLPALWQALAPLAPPGTRFQIAGYGSLEAQVRSRVAAMADAAIPVAFTGYGVAGELLPPAAIVLSLQETTNFPSRVVAEALIAGCAVIVRDTGDSRQFGSDPGLQYCAERLDGEALAAQIAPLLAQVLGEPAFGQEVRRAALARYSNAAYISYFRDLMGARALAAPGAAEAA